MGETALYAGKHELLKQNTIRKKQEALHAETPQAKEEGKEDAGEKEPGKEKEKEKKKDPSSEGLKLVQAEVIILERLMHFGIPVMPKTSDKKSLGFMVSWLTLRKSCLDTAMSKFEEARQNFSDQSRKVLALKQRLESAFVSFQQSGGQNLTGQKAGPPDKQIKAMNQLLEFGLNDERMAHRELVAAQATLGVMEELTAEAPCDGLTGSSGSQFICPVSFGFARISLLLLHAVLDTFPAPDRTRKQSRGKTSDAGLGAMIIDEGIMVKNKWQKALGLYRDVSSIPGCSSIAYTKSTVYLREKLRNAEGRLVLAVELNSKLARTCFGQFAQQTMLRTCYYELQIGSIAQVMKKIVREIETSGDDWMQPLWWTAQCDLGLLSGLMEVGWDGIEQIFTNPRYQLTTTFAKWVEKDMEKKRLENEKKKLEAETPKPPVVVDLTADDEAPAQAQAVGAAEIAQKAEEEEKKQRQKTSQMQTRAVIQIRANHLVRELTKVMLTMNRSSQNAQLANQQRLFAAQQAAKQEKQRAEQQAAAARTAAQASAAQMQTQSEIARGGIGLTLNLATQDIEAENQQPEAINKEAGRKRPGEGLPPSMGVLGGLEQSTSGSAKKSKPGDITAYFSPSKDGAEKA
jgi:hypothetical protein